MKSYDQSPHTPPIDSHTVKPPSLPWKNRKWLSGLATHKFTSVGFGCFPETCNVTVKFIKYWCISRRGYHFSNFCFQIVGITSHFCLPIVQPLNKSCWQFQTTMLKLSRLWPSDQTQIRLCRWGPTSSENEWVMFSSAVHPTHRNHYKRHHTKREDSQRLATWFCSYTNCQIWWIFKVLRIHRSGYCWGLDRTFWTMNDWERQMLQHWKTWQWSIQCFAISTE